MIDLRITQHARRRYAERIMGYDGTNVSTFMANHEEKIKTDISKMVEFGKLIFSGCPTDMESFGKNPVDVYLSGFWIVIVDNVKMTVVTLFKIDFGAGEDVDELFLNNCLKKLEEASMKSSLAKVQAGKQKAEFSEMVRENNLLIADYQNKIKNLQEQNSNLSALLYGIDDDIYDLQNEERKVIATLIQKKIF